MSLQLRRSPPLIEPGRYDPEFQYELEQLHKLSMHGRWVAVRLMWLFVAPLSLWLMRNDIYLMHDHFTWASLRYSLAFHPMASLGLILCLGLTTSVLLSQSRTVLLGLSNHDLKYLEKRLSRIRKQGKSHPLWNVICDHPKDALHPPNQTQP